MVNENLIPKTETVYEIKNETQSVVGDQIPSYEEFMKNYEKDDSMNYDDLSGGSIGEVKGYGPCIDCSGSNESLTFKLKINLKNCMGSLRSKTVYRTGDANCEAINIEKGWRHWEDGFLDYFSQGEREKLVKRIKKKIEWHEKGNNVDTEVCNEDSGGSGLRRGYQCLEDVEIMEYWQYGPGATFNG